MRILMTADAIGGVWQYALDLAAGLAARKVETVLAVLGPKPGARQRQDALAVPGLHLVPTGMPLDWTASSSDEVHEASRSIAELANRVSADLIHLNGPSLAISQRFDVPVVAVAHSCVATWWAAVKTDPLPADFRWRADLVRSGLLAADVTAAPSRALANALAETYALPRVPRVVHNGRAKPPVTAKPLDGEPFVFTAGRLWDEGKNIATLQQAALRLPIRVVAAGSRAGPNGATVEIDGIEAIGNLSSEAMREWLCRRPIFVSTALYEPFGLAVLEAAQAGCALVLSDIATFRELWGGAALFVPPRDHGALFLAITRLAEDPTLRRRIGAVARARSRQFGLGAMADATFALYRSALTQPSSTPAMVAS